jgi:hypothetical protein
MSRYCDHCGVVSVRVREIEERASTKARLVCRACQRERDRRRRAVLASETVSWDDGDDA